MYNISLAQHYLATPQPQNKVQCRVLLDAVVLKGVAVLELLPGEDEALLVWWNALLVMDLGLDALDAVGWLDLKRYVLANKGLDENLHELL